jgi:error-prone DNA polymerase
MGFYAPSQLVQDAQRHGVEVRAVDVRVSDWDCTLERGEDGRPAVRLGLRQVKGLSAEAAGRIVEARRAAALENVQDLAERARLDRGDLSALAAADTLAGLAGHRHRARWDVAGVEPVTPLMERVRIPEGVPLLRAPREGEEIVADYANLGFSLRRHPLALLRDQLTELNLCSARDLQSAPHGVHARTGGLVVTRQRPGSASGVTFVTLEDETGHVNLIVWRNVAERYRRALVGARLLGASGTVQREGEVLHLVVARLYDYSRLLGDLTTRSRDFH